jgi:twitching motility protein PilT
MNDSLHSNLSSTARLNHWLETLMQQSGSDLLLVPGAAPSILVNGKVRSIEESRLEGDAIEAAVLPALTPHGLQLYKDNQIADASYRVSNLGRFRINLHRERGRAAAAIRALPSKVPEIGALHLPSGVEALARLPRGLVLVGGPAGSGKSTTVAALINVINRSDARHIVTIEDPIEYEHTHIRSVIEQMEVGDDVPDFPTALRSSLRQAPDVIVVGEMRDPELCVSRSLQPRPDIWYFPRSIPPTSFQPSLGYAIPFPWSGKTLSGRS